MGDILVLNDKGLSGKHWKKPKVEQKIISLSKPPAAVSAQHVHQQIRRYFCGSSAMKNEKDTYTKMKEEVLASISRVDRDMTRVELSISMLKKKEDELKKALSFRQSLTDVAKSLYFPIQGSQSKKQEVTPKFAKRIYEENKVKAAKFKLPLLTSCEEGMPKQKETVLGAIITDTHTYSEIVTDTSSSDAVNSALDTETLNETSDSENKMVKYDAVTSKSPSALSNMNKSSNTQSGASSFGDETPLSDDMCKTPSSDDLTKASSMERMKETSVSGDLADASTSDDQNEAPTSGIETASELGDCTETTIPSDLDMADATNNQDIAPTRNLNEITEVTDLDQQVPSRDGPPDNAPDNAPGFGDMNKTTASGNRDTITVSNDLDETSGVLSAAHQHDAVSPSIQENPLTKITETGGTVHEEVTGMSDGSCYSSNVCGQNFGNMYINSTVKEEEPEVYFSISKMEDKAKRIKLSVPHKDGHTSLNIVCHGGNIRDLKYEHDDGKARAFRTKWTIQNTPKGFMRTIMDEYGEEFTAFVELLENLFDCKFSKAYNKCLVLEFLHEDEKNARSMMDDQEFVKGRFNQFLQEIGQEGMSCTLDVSCQHADSESDDSSDITKDQYDGRIPEDESDITVSNTCGPNLSQQGTSMGKSPLRTKRKRKWKDDFEFQPGSSTSEKMSNIQIKPFIKRMKYQWKESETCDRCQMILEQSKTKLVQHENILIAHFPVETAFDPNEYTNDKRCEILKYISSLRNSNGGKLFIHLSCKRQNLQAVDDFMSFFDDLFSEAVGHDEIDSDVVTMEPVQQYDDAYVIHTEASETLITVDFKTKLPTSIWHTAPTKEKLKSFLSAKRKVYENPPIIRGLADSEQDGSVLKLYYPESDNVEKTDDMVETIMEELLLPEFITSCSKRKQGGSIYIGHQSTVKSEILNESLDFTGLKIESEEKFCSSLHQALKERLLLFSNAKSNQDVVIDGVFEIELHKLDDGFVIEVAVRAVKGCVFYDPKGPESYKIEKGVIQRIPFDTWIKDVFGDFT